MSIKRWFAFGAVALAAALSLACVNNVTTATGTGGRGGDNGGGSNPSATPSPGAAGSLPAGSFVRQGFYGISCPQGTPAPANGLRELPLPCRGFLTATPKYADGTDIPAAVHGPNCSWEITSGAAIVNLQTTGEAFNRDATCNSAGPWALKATVLNVSGEAGYNCTSTASKSGALGDSDFWSLLGGSLDHERANGRDYYFATWASAEQRAGAKARDAERIRRGER